MLGRLVDFLWKEERMGNDAEDYRPRIEQGLSLSFTMVHLTQTGVYIWVSVKS